MPVHNEPERPPTRPKPYPLQLDFERFANFVLVTLLAQFGVFGLVAAAVYVGVLSFEESSGDGLRSIILFVLPFLWGMLVVEAQRRRQRAFALLSGWAVPVLGVVIGAVISAGIVAEAPVSLTNLGLGVMAGFYLLVNSIGDSDQDFVWGLALLLMVSIIGITIAVIA